MDIVEFLYKRGLTVDITAKVALFFYWWQTNELINHFQITIAVFFQVLKKCYYEISQWLIEQGVNVNADNPVSD
jgi:hypothetical protein